MIRSSNLAYLSRRAEQEAIMAIAADNPVASAAHNAICRSYCDSFNRAMRLAHLRIGA
tara:strand:+ start:293 stop:466 length:174 start_codon:yes stop_codon:yes gene_type:complete